MAQSSFGQLRDLLRLGRLALAALVLLLPVALAAQQPATLTGRVTSECRCSRWPLPASSSSSWVREQLPVPTGAIRILIPGARVPSAPVTVTVRLVGYKATSAQVDLSAGLGDPGLHPARQSPAAGGAGRDRRRHGVARWRSWAPDAAAWTRCPSSAATSRTWSNSLAAKAPNVEVTSSSGDPGASSFIQIRGLDHDQGSGVRADAATVHGRRRTGRQHHQLQQYRQRRSVN